MEAATNHASPGGRASPPSALVRFRALLGEEREAARRADTAALVALQDAKREALKALQAEPEAFASARAALAEEAERNVALLRQRRRLYEGALDIRRPTYGRGGHREARAATRSWGTR